MASLVSRTMRPAVAAAGRRFVLMRPLSMTTARRADDASQASELGVGELQGAKFRIEPLRRVGEDDATKRARLVFPQARNPRIRPPPLDIRIQAPPHAPPKLLDQYDLLLDENDWDIYYWATQKEELSSTNPSSEDAKPSSDEVTRHPPTGEWAQTVGNFKPAYRPVPARWKDSEILAMLRDHVRNRSVDGGEGGGMGFMPPLDA
ncbi:hypothetical protein MRS44_007882 [Fusarium solani]|uniref:uncharacterized protein n=1 Tax=Fusarium solani TaxID=169388 RepID=UPI0032C449B8|nr:hypothetical protein MRS44_007882 [Fusarium solani]